MLETVNLTRKMKQSIPEEQDFFFLHLSRKVTMAAQELPKGHGQDMFRLPKDVNQAFFSFRMNSRGRYELVDGQTVTMGEGLVTFGSDPQSAANPRFNSQKVTRGKLALISWFQAPAVSIRFHRSKGPQTELRISREKFIRKTSNTLGGSHPPVSPMDEYQETLALLSKYRVLGLPIPYFSLMEIASCLVEKLPALFSRKAL